MIFATAPFIGAVLSWLVLADSIEVVQVVAMPLAAIGVALSLRSAHEIIYFVFEYIYEYDY